MAESGPPAPMERLRRWFKPPRKLRFTPLGVTLTILTVGVGLAAMNTGNNLVYMVFGMMLGFITASGLLSEMSLRGLETDWIVPGELFAGQPAVLRLILRNAKASLPSFGLWVELQLDPPQDKVEPRHFLYLPAGTRMSADFTITPARRGRLNIRALKIETRFPFGFFAKSLLRKTDQALVVYPRLKTLSIRGPDPALLLDRKPAARKGPGDSYWGMKEFVPGDDPRKISWKSSAKRARLLVMETEKETEKRLVAAMSPAALWRRLTPDELERALSFAASYVCDKIKDGYAVGFLAPGLAMPPLHGQAARKYILEYLALFQPAQATPEEDLWPVESLHWSDEPPLELGYLWKKWDS